MGDFWRLEGHGPLPPKSAYAWVTKTIYAQQFCLQASIFSLGSQKCDLRVVI